MGWTRLLKLHNLDYRGWMGMPATKKMMNWDDPWWPLSEDLRFMRTMNYENYMKELQIQESMARLTSQQLVTASDCKMLPFLWKKSSEGTAGDTRWVAIQDPTFWWFQRFFIFHNMGCSIIDIGNRNIWLVVSIMNFIFHFIYGMSSFPLTNPYFQDG